MRDASSREHARQICQDLGMDAMIANDNADRFDPGPGTDTALLQAWHVSKISRLGSTERHVLNNCCLTVRKGQMVCIHCDQSSARSELMSILAGFDSPTRGMVLFEDGPLIDPFSCADAALRRRRIGHLFASGMLLPALSARANVRAVLDGLHRPGMTEGEIRNKVSRALDRGGFAGDRDVPATDLNRLERVKAGLATSLVKEPRVLLCDGGLDGLGSDDAAAMLEIFDALRGTLGMGIVLATATPLSAQGAQQTLALRHGRLTPVKGFA